jgi:hypothetical protein
VHDPLLMDFMANEVGKKCPPTLRDDKWVVWPKLGVELLFAPATENSKYPQVAKGTSYVPYLTTLSFSSRCRLRLPFDVQPGLSDDQLEARFGRPDIHAYGGARSKRWHVPLIGHRDVVLSCYGSGDGTVFLRIKTDSEQLSTAR